MLYNPMFSSQGLDKSASTGKPRPITFAAEVMSTKNLVAWLETKDPNEAYRYDNVYEPCLHAQYFAAMGRPVQSLGAMSVIFPGRGHVDHMPQSFVTAALPKPHTFGAALERAKAFLK